MVIIIITSYDYEAILYSLYNSIKYSYIIAIIYTYHIAK